MSSRLAEPMLTTQEVAARLNVHPATVRRWRLAGGGPVYFKIGTSFRYPVTDLERWLAESCMPETLG
jgi:excisionase family DNA binding protein